MQGIVSFTCLKKPDKNILAFFVRQVQMKSILTVDDQLRLRGKAQILNTANGFQNQMTAGLYGGLEQPLLGPGASAEQPCDMENFMGRSQGKLNMRLSAFAPDTGCVTFA